MAHLRKAAVAGMFYPGEEGQLRWNIKNFIENTIPESAQKVKILITPHAGYTYSGAIAGQILAEMKPYYYDHVIILGPSHRHYFTGIVQSGNKEWETPMGIQSIRSLESVQIQSIPQYHVDEHCLEVQLPFLQYLYNGEISPLLISGQLEQASEFAAILASFDTNNTLWIISSDLNHVGSSFRYSPEDYGYETGEEMDRKAISLIESGNIEKFKQFLLKTEATICGRLSILTAMHLRTRLGLPNFKLKTYNCSGRMTGDENSVGYGGLYC